MWHATWQKLHSQQLPCGKYLATLAFWWGQGPFSKKKIAGIFSHFFLQGRKPKLVQITGTKIIFKPSIQLYVGFQLERSWFI